MEQAALRRRSRGVHRGKSARRRRWLEPAGALTKWRIADGDPGYGGSRRRTATQPRWFAAGRATGETDDVSRAAIAAGTLNPLVVQAMREVGIDISQARTKSVAEMVARGPVFDYVITVCDEASAERCPVFLGPAVRLYWGFPDPSTLTGSHADRIAAVRTIRDQIRARVAEWCRELRAS